MTLIETDFDGLYLIKPQINLDSRGYFFRTFCKNEFNLILFNKEFVQFNHSHSNKSGTIRGLHFQKFPFEETKLIRCVSGSIFDVVVDLRKESKTYMKHYTIELNDQNNYSILVPSGFAHGFQTLKDNSSLIYHHTEYYNPEYETGLRYNDPKIGINWPLELTEISERDSKHTLL